MELAKRRAHFYTKHGKFILYFATRTFSQSFIERWRRKEKKKQQLDKLLLDSTFNWRVKALRCYAKKTRKNRGELVGELNLLVERKFIDQVDELFKDPSDTRSLSSLDVNNSTEKWSELK